MAERLVVPTKPGNAGGGKGPQFKGTPQGGESGDWREPATSGEDSEASSGVACQSEGITRLSLLPAVRQGVPRGRAGARLRALQSQWWSGGSRRPEVRGHRDVRGRTVAGGTGGSTQEEGVSAAGGAAGLHPQAGRNEAAAGDPDHPGSCGADGGGAGLGADLRGRPATGAIRVSPGPQRAGRGEESPLTAEHGAHRGGGRGPVRLLRQHPARGADEVGGSADQRSARAASDQAVAGGADRGNRRARE